MRLLAIAAAAGIAVPGAALAAPEEPDERRRVLLVVDDPADPFIGRIRAEVALLGVEVVMRAPQGQIEASARSEHAVAAIRMLPSRRGVEVWMADETSGRSLLRQVVVDETPRGPNENLIALQTAELLRTSLFPRPTPPASHPADAPPVVVTPAPPPASGESQLVSSVGLLSGGGDAGPAWQAGLAVQHFWNDRFGFAISLSAPFQRGTMSGPEGTADVGAVTIGPEALARFESAHGRLFMTTGLGAALVYVLATGHPREQASAQLMSSLSTAYTGLGYARLTLGWKLSRWVDAGLNVVAGTTIARVQVRFAGNAGGRMGHARAGCGPVCGRGLALTAWQEIDRQGSRRTSSIQTSHCCCVQMMKPTS